MHANRNFILAGKTIGSLKKNVIEPMQDILGAWGWDYRYNRSENYLMIGTNTYYCYDANNEASQDKLQGLTAAGAYADEAALFPQSFVNQMLARCSAEGAKVFLNCNPEGRHHYLNEDYILQAAEKNICHLHFLMSDNLTLSAETLKRYETMYSGVFHKRNVLGEWVAADGLCYPSFADNPEYYEIDDSWIAQHPITYAVIGVDFGGTKSAHAFCAVGFGKGFRDVVVLRDYYRRERINPSELEADFVDFVKSIQARYTCFEVYCDSAEQTLMSGLEAACLSAGVRIDIKNALKSPINDRIGFYNSMMAQSRFRIHERCKATREALEAAVYDDEETTKDVRLDDGTTNIDSLDALEYTTERLMDDIMYL